MAMLSVGARATAMGAVKLDNYTFDKLIATPGLTVMVKVDKSYAYGEKEDAFKALCKLAYPVKDLLIAEIPVQEYGDKENEDVATRLGVKTDEFPAYFLFKGSVESVVKFVGFPNPASSKPKNWDDEEDGEWEAPTIDNPVCKVGCGKWVPPTISNPAYKGKWHAPKIDNPDYKGIWKAKQIPNPNYFFDENPYVLPTISGVGIDIWTMSKGILFDNIVLGSDPTKAKEFADQSWKIRKEIEELQRPGKGNFDSIIEKVSTNAKR